MSIAGSSGARRVDVLQVMLYLGIVCLLIWQFHFQGNLSEIQFFSKSVLRWMILRWGHSTLSIGEYSHGWIIPLVSMYALWHRRRDILASDIRVYWPALFAVVGGLLLHWVGIRAQQPRISLFSLIVVLWAIPCFLHGRSIGKILVFPCYYLIFCIPFNFFDSFSFSLRMLATSVASSVLNGVGISVHQSGSAIYSVSGAFSLEVADPCSGIRSLLAMTALTAAYAYFTQNVWWKRTILFLSAIPLAVAGNVVRVTTIGMVAHFAGQEKALDFYHNYSGYLVFIVATLLMVIVGNYLESGHSGRENRVGADECQPEKKSNERG